MDRDILCKVKEKAGVALLSNKIDLKPRLFVRDKESHYILIKGMLHQEDLILINVYTPNIEAGKYVEQILMDIKGEDDRSIVLVGAFNTPLTSVDKSSKQKTNKDTAPLNDITSNGFI